MKRRELLQQSAVLGAYMAFTPLHSFARLLRGEEQPTKGSSLQHVGLLLSTNGNDSCALDVQAGLLKATSSGSWKFLPSEAAKNLSAQRRALVNLMQQNELDFLVSMSGIRQRFYYSPLYTEKHIPCLEVNLGENITQTHPTLGSASLNAWQSNYAAGMYAAQFVGKRAVVISTSYDSGYDCFASLQKGFSDKGGEIVHRVITDAPPQIPGISSSVLDKDFIKACRSAKAECILLHCSGSAALSTLNFLDANGISLPVVASYQSLPGLRQSTRYKGEIATALPSSLMQSKDSYIADALNNMKFFSILGYMAGLRLATVKENHIDTTNASEVEYSICKVSIASNTIHLQSTSQSLQVDSASVSQQMYAIDTQASGNILPYLL